jgi:hypothetical protein
MKMGFVPVDVCGDRRSLRKIGCCHLKLIDYRKTSANSRCGYHLKQIDLWGRLQPTAVCSPLALLDAPYFDFERAGDHLVLADGFHLLL